MKPLSAKPYLEKLRPLLLIAGGFFFYTVILGLRGTGTAGVELMDRLRAVNTALMNQKAADLLSSPHVFVDVLSIPMAALFDNEVFGFGLVSALAVSLTLPAIWRMADAVCGSLGAALATGLFLGLPIVAGAATAAGPAAIVLLMWCWLLRLSTLTRYTWWTSLLLVLLAAAMALSWAPVLIWLPAWLVATIAARGIQNKMPDPQARGMIGPSAVPLALVLATVGIVVLPSLFFIAIGFEAGSLPSAWDGFLTHALLADWPPVLFGGEVFSTKRPPLTTGLMWTAFEFPPEVVIGAVAALLLPVTRRFGIFVENPPRAQDFALPRSFSVLTLVFLLGLPWALRTRAVGGVPTMLLVAPILAILAGNLFAMLLRVALDWLEAREVALTSRRGALVALFGLFLLPGLVMTVLVHPFEESYHNLFAGSIDGAIRAGHPATRSDVLPIEVAESVAERAGTRALYAGPWRTHLEAYVREGYIEPLNLTEDPVDWQARLHERETESKKLEDEPATQVMFGPEGVGVFVLDIRD